MIRLLFPWEFADPLPPPYDQLLGPVGLTVGALIVVGFLARELFKFIREYIASLEEKNSAYISSLEEINVELRTQLAEAIKGWQGQTQANQTLGEAQASRNRDDEMRHRVEEAKQPARSARGGRT